MELPPLLAIGGLMTAALYFHFSIGDALIKSLPAALMLSACTLIYFLRFQKQEEAKE
jgi:flagellar biosynthesis component FlhA